VDAWPEPALIVSPQWRQGFPGACAGLLALSEVSCPQACPELDRARAEVEADLGRRFADRQAVKGHPRIQVYTAYYKRFKKTYHVAQQVESVATKGKQIPAAAPLVQAMFMAELKNLLLTAGHDRQTLRGPVRLEMADGGESYQGLGGQIQQLKAGDMFIADDLGVLSSVIYGPDERSKITRSTSAAIFCVYGPAGVEPLAVEDHLKDIAVYARLFSPAAKTDLLKVYRAD